MTRETAERIVKGIADKIEANTADMNDWAEFWGFTVDEYEEFLDMAIKALEREQCEDAVSRQAVLDKKELVELEDGQSFYCISPEDVKILSSVTPARRWIPVTEKLPKADETVLVSLAPLPNCIKQIAISSMFDNKTWKIKATVDAWMPLPEPYKAQESEETDANSN